VSSKSRETLRLGLILFWLVFSISFAVWWFVLSMEHISTLARLEPDQMAHWQRQQRMMFWEGSAWMILLAGGAAALLALVRREKRRGRRIREFFASFSHDVKTSLASLRLQAEALAADHQSSPILERLIGDTVRLQLQLENSLFLSSEEELKLFIEHVRLSQLVERLREQWPGLQVQREDEAILIGDERALRTLFSNLAKNSVVHGQASELRVHVEPGSKGRVRLRFEDNGEGFEGSVEELGQLFHRPKTSSGSGLGLYISRLLVERMGGRLLFHAGHHGFRVDVEIGGELK
jgi:hypothetical protein